MEERDSSGVRTQFYHFREVFSLLSPILLPRKENRSTLWHRLTDLKLMVPLPQPFEAPPPPAVLTLGTFASILVPP